MDSESEDTCVVCKSEEAIDGMRNMCPDCYWDADAERKKAQRADPVWRFNSICSFARTCMNMDQAGAIAFALKEMKLDKPPTHG